MDSKEKLKQIKEEYRKNDLSVKDTQITIRTNRKIKAKAKYYCELGGFKNLSDYISYLLMKDINEKELKQLKEIESELF